MPGFLERLAGRTLALTAVAQPVIPVAFDRGPRLEASDPLAGGEVAADRGSPAAAPDSSLLQERRGSPVSVPEPKALPFSLHTIRPEATLPNTIAAATARDTAQTPEAISIPPAALAGEPTPTRSMAPAWITAASPSTGPSASHGPHAASLAAPEEAPVIRVTIGRIDVRAEIAAPPVRPAGSRPRPAMSLEDYRRRRDGGGR